MAKKPTKTKAQLRSRRRFSAGVALFFITVIVGYLGFRLIASHAANTDVTSGYVIDQNGRGVAGVGIFGCNLGSTSTDANGHWQLIGNQNQAYCVRISSRPAYVSGGTAYNSPFSGVASYEYQALGAACYNNPTYCGAGKIGGSNEVLTHDLPWNGHSEQQLNFRVSYNPPTPHGCGPGTLNDRCPPPPPPPSGGGTTTGGGTTGGGTRGGGGSGGSSGGGAATIDGSVSVPSTPGNFSANSNVIGTILNWSLSSGGSGAITYSIDRSTDQVNWESAATSLSGSTFADTGTSYGTLYYYRIRATDTAGNSSDYSLAQVTTETYSPNANSGNNQTITSDDQNVNAMIPTGAIATDAACAIVTQSEVQSSAKTKLRLILGPYLLICRTSDGSVINNFSQPIQYVVSVPANMVKTYRNFDIAQSKTDSPDWKNIKASYDSKAHSLKFSDSNADTFAVSAQTKTPIASYVSIGLGVLALGALGYFGYKRKDQIVEWFYRH